METVPILRDGQNIGTLEICREGMYTRFRADCAWCGEVLRLRILGEGSSAELGTLLPDGQGRATLTRRFAPRATAEFPSPVTAAVAELREEQPVCLPEEEKPEPESPESPAETLSTEEVTQPEEEDCLWYSCPDGCLTRFDGRRNWHAIPAELTQVPSGAEQTLREIGGKRYWVFPE